MKVIVDHNIMYGDMIYQHVHTFDNGDEVYLSKMAIPHREFDATNRNNYKVSDINQWLNSDEPAGEWFKKNEKGALTPSYYDAPGFLQTVSPSFLSRLKKTEYGYFFLPSYTELTGSPNNGVFEGEQWDALKGENARGILKKVDVLDGKPVWWWTRSANAWNPAIVRGVDSVGDATGSLNCAANPSVGAVAACIIPQNR